MPKITATGTITVTNIDEEALRAFLEPPDPDPNVERALEQSRLSGLDVVMPTGFDDLPWAPVWRWPAKDPVAWVHVVTGERRAENPYMTDDPTAPKPSPPTV